MKKECFSCFSWPLEKYNAVCIFLHDFNVNPSWFSYLAEYLNREGVYCYAIDLFAPRNRNKDKIYIGKESRNYLKIINCLIYEQRKKFRDMPVFVAGEGFGAIIAMRFAQEFSTAINGLIVMSPIFKMRISIKVLLKTLLFYIVKPKKSFLYDLKLSMLTKAEWFLQGLEKYEHNHYFYTVAFILDFILQSFKAQRSPGKIKVPVMFMLAEDDLYTDNKLSQKYYSRLEHSDKKINIYKEFHMLSVPSKKEPVYRDITEWINARVTRL